MKNTLTLKHEKHQIVMDRTFAKNAENTRSPEYAQLQQVRKDYPTFEVVTKKIKKNPNKETYKGLTYDYMEFYIMTHESKETVSKVLEEFEELKLISLCHSKGKRYPVIKKWFLEKYPVIENFGKDNGESNSNENEQGNIVNATIENKTAEKAA